MLESETAQKNRRHIHARGKRLGALYGKPASDVRVAMLEEELAWHQRNTRIRPCPTLERAGCTRDDEQDFGLRQSDRLRAPH
jgi:hypothetical protein